MKDSLLSSSVEDVIQLLNFAEQVYTTQSFDEFSLTLPVVAQIARSPSALLYVSDSRLTSPVILQYGFGPYDENQIAGMCDEQYKLILTHSGMDSLSVSALKPWEKIATFLYPLKIKETIIGMLGLMLEQDASKYNEAWDELMAIFANAINRLADHSKTERKLAHLTTYLTVSTMIAQPLGLNEVLETILHACIQAASAEEASILLLDDDKKNFVFYQVEGSSKQILKGARFPADRGIAGLVMRTQHPEIINDVQTDPRFYGKIDSRSGLKTRNMIAIPLTAGEERIGVLEILNKSAGKPFNTEEHLILSSIAEEIAFAIRNASIFEYIVNSYCKQRQGLATCRGCKRPLGSWTPCVKYREAVDVFF